MTQRTQAPSRFIPLTRMLPAFLLTMCGLAGDAGAQLHARPIIDSAAVYELEGYSVLPPQGKNWFEMRRDMQQALFGKKIESRTHAFVATATSGQVEGKFEKPEQFQEYVSKIRIADADPTRKIIEYSFEFDSSFPAWCVRYHFKTEDRGAPYSQGTALLLEDFGVTCLHPTLPGLVIDVGYSERGRPGEINTDLRAEGEAFMRSLKFTTR